MGNLFYHLWRICLGLIQRFRIAWGLFFLQKNCHKVLLLDEEVRISNKRRVRNNMKKRVIGFGLALMLGMSSTAYAAPVAAFGDSSRGNHPLAPYKESNIIVPRPEASKYAPLQKYPYKGIPADVKGHWAEKYITYFLQTGVMTTEANGAFVPNKVITYGDFAEAVARLGLDPVEFCDGSVSYKVFMDYALWNQNSSVSQAGNICGEAGIWGNPSEATFSMTGYPGFRMGDTAQRQYIVSFLANMLDPMTQTETQRMLFRDSDRIRSAMIREDMERMVSERIISGFSDGTIRPEAPVTKAELAVMIYKVLEKSDFDMDKISEHLYGNYHAYYWQEEKKLLELVNQERKWNGRKPLNYNADLNALCEIKMLEKSIYGYDNFTQLIKYDGKTIAAGHVSKYYGRATEMAEIFGLNGYRVGENAVQNAPYAAKAHNSLTNSSAHRENYLKDDYEKAGFAVGGKLTYQMFAYTR